MSKLGWRLFWLFQSGCILLLAFRRKVEAWVEHG